MKAIDRLEKMVGHEFMLNASNVKVLSYEVEDRLVTIVTDKKWHKKNLDTLSEFLDELLPTASGHGVTTTAILPQLQINSSVIQTLKDTLLENINKVKESREYIPQSEEINKNVKSIIDLSKTEVEMAKIMLEAHKFSASS